MQSKNVTDESDARLTEALRQFLWRFATPPLPSIDAIRLGYENDAPLPEGNDFCVISLLSLERQGTAVEDWDANTDGIEIGLNMEAQVQIDCFSDSRARARERAQAYEALCAHEVGLTFLRTYGVDVKYNEGTRNLSSVLDSGKYLSRYSLTLRVGFWKKVGVNVDSFTSLDLAGVHNVDVKFSPYKEE